MIELYSLIVYELAEGSSTGSGAPEPPIEKTFSCRPSASHCTLRSSA